MKLFQLFNTLKVRVKLLLAFGSILFLSLIIVTVLLVTGYQLNCYQKARERIESINALAIELDRYVTYFSLEGFKSPQFLKEKKSDVTQQFFDNQTQIQWQLDTLLNGQFAKEIPYLDSIKINATELESGFHELINTFSIRGFKDFGLEGELRTAIHDVEQSTYPYNKADMLMLRRHEKDFFLRKDRKYLKEFISQHEEMYNTIAASEIEEGKKQVLSNLEKYRQKFEEVVGVEEQIGLTESTGIKSQLRSKSNTLRNAVAKSKRLMNEFGRRTESRAILVLSIVLTAQLIMGILMAVLYSAVITKAVKQLLSAMKKLAEGIYPDPLPIISEDELGQTKTAFNQLLGRMKSASDFSNALGEGKLQTEYSTDHKSDVLASSLIKMQEALLEAQGRQERINWTNYGSAQLNEILKLENENIELIADKILGLLVHYLPVNQGAIYLMKEDSSNKYLDRIATYAYNKKKFISQRIEIGQGLIGQCVLELEPIIITAVPADYIKITSGLGEALPRFVIIMPLVIQGKALGAMEFAAFEKLEEYKIEFLKKISENITSILSNKLINEQTRLLLAEAHAKEQQLKSQEEELRQNTEEMQAVQEEMQRQHRQLEREIEELRSANLESMLRVAQ